MTPNPFSSPTRCPRGPFPRPSFRTARRAERTHICFIEPMEPRLLLAAASVDKKAIFAGGLRWGPANTDPANNGRIVNIYDAGTGNWSTAKLSLGRGRLTAASVAGKALFAGGDPDNSTRATDVVDIYDSATGRWSTAKLSQARTHAVATTVGDRAIFVGGLDTKNAPSRVVDIYDADTG